MLSQQSPPKPPLPSTSDIQHAIRVIDPELLVADGFDSAIIGIASRCGSPDVVAYDYDKCITALIVEQGMDDIEAVEHFEYNVIGSYEGDRTPIFIRSL
jgi:hypothetical protein